MTTPKQNTFDELWSSKAKEMMRNTLFLDEIRDFVREWLQQKQKFYSKGSASLRSKNAMFNELLEELKQ